jgi:hypothetical protein
MTSIIPQARQSIAILALVLAAAPLAGCESVQYIPPPQAAAAPPPPMTRSRAAAECWMETEKGRAGMDIDKRADVVTKCIAQKMKTPKPAPKT